MKTQGKYHLLFLPAPQSSVRCCKIFVIEGFSKFMSFLQKNKTIDWKMLLPRSDVSHFRKASFNFSYVPVFTLCCFSDEFWKSSKIFSLFFFQVGRVLPGILNWFTTFLLGFPFSSSYNAAYFTFKVEVNFFDYFYCASHQQSNWNKFKDFKTFEYYGIRIVTFKFATAFLARVY